MRKTYKAVYYKRGKHKGWLRSLTFYMPHRKDQQGYSTAFPLFTKLGIFTINVPNIIGIEKISLEFNYSEKYLHPYK